MSQVVIAEVGDKDSGYADFLSRLPPSDCRYGGETPTGKPTITSLAVPTKRNGILTALT